MESAKRFLPHDYKEAIEMLSGHRPVIILSVEAFNSQWHYVNKADDAELGWMGTVYRSGNIFKIEKVFLFRQTRTPTAAIITTEGLSEVGTEILDSHKDGIEILNHLHYWAHSHVNMGTSPSAQDDSQMEIFEDCENDFFVRGILNRKGRMEFTIYLYSVGIKITDIEWSIEEPNNNELEARIQAEFEEKIEPKEANLDNIRQHTKTNKMQEGNEPKIKEEEEDNFVSQSP